MSALATTADRQALADEQATLTAKIAGLESDHQRFEDRLVELAAEREKLDAEMERVAEAIRQNAMRSQTVHEQKNRNGQQIDLNKARLAEVSRMMPVPRQRQPTPDGKAGVPDVEQAAARFGTFTADDIAAALKIKPRSASAMIMTLVTDGQVRETGRKVFGKKLFEHLGAAQERKEEEAESVKLVRQFVVKCKEPFSPADVTAATEVAGQELIEALQTSLRRGVIRYVGFDDLELYEYVPPTDPGEAAKKDIELRKERARAEANGVGGAPVAGTGKGATISDPDVRALLTAVRAAGGDFAKTAGGHYEVTAPGSKKRVLVSSTPSNRRSVLNDRARVRRELGLKIT